MEAPEDFFGEDVRRDATDAKSWEAVKEPVVKRWEASPGVTVDFELRDETLRLLEKTPTADLEAWMRALRPTKWTDDDKDVPLQLREMLMTVLVQREGASFIRSLDEHPLEGGGIDVSEAVDHWIRHDPVAVLDWLDGEVPEEIERRLDSYREDSFECLSVKDPAEFERRVVLEDAEMREGLLERHAIRKGSGEGRAGLLAKAAASPHGDAMALWQGLLRREGMDDPARAYATLKELDVSPEDRAELDEDLVFHLLYPARSLVVEPTNGTDGSDVMQAWVERNTGESVSERMLRTFGMWSESDPERAAMWVAEQPAGFRHEAFGKVLHEEPIDHPEEFAGKVARIGDADVRHAMQRRLKASWREKNPEEAAEWEKGLPEEERERLK